MNSYARGRPMRRQSKVTARSAKKPHFGFCHRISDVLTCAGLEGVFEAVNDGTARYGIVPMKTR